MKNLKDFKPTEKDFKPTEKDFQLAEKGESKPSKWITIPQDLLEDWWGKLDSVDGALIGYILNWSKSPKVQRYPGDDRFVWINLGYLLRCLPILNIEYRTLKRHIRKLDNLGVIERMYAVDSRTGQLKLYIRVVPQDEPQDELQDEPQSKPKKKKKSQDKPKKKSTGGFSEKDIRADGEWQKAELILEKYFRPREINPKSLTAKKRFEKLCELISDETFDFEAYCKWYKEEKYPDKKFNYGLFLFPDMIEEFRESQEGNDDTYLKGVDWNSEENKRHIQETKDFIDTLRD